MHIEYAALASFYTWGTNSWTQKGGGELWMHWGSALKTYVERRAQCTSVM